MVELKLKDTYRKKVIFNDSGFKTPPPPHQTLGNNRTITQKTSKLKCSSILPIKPVEHSLSCISNIVKLLTAHLIPKKMTVSNVSSCYKKRFFSIWTIMIK